MIKTKRKAVFTVPRLCALAAASSLVGWAAPGFAQGVDIAGLAGGALVTLDIGVGYEYEIDDGAPNESELLSTFLLGVTSETRNQRFNFSVGSQLTLDEGSFDFQEPNGRLSYALFNRNTEASINLRYSEIDVGDTVEELDGDNITATTGRRETHAATLRLQTGRAMRFGTDTVLNYRQIDFIDTVDPDLFSQIRHDARTTLRFSLDRRIELRVFASWSETVTDETPIETDTVVSFGTGATFLIDRAWTGSVDLAWTDIESEQGGVIDQEDGIAINLGLTRDMRNGTLAFSFDRAVAEADTIDRLEATRALELANGAAVSASAALLAFDDGDVLPAFGFTYDHEFLRGRTVRASLTQDGAVDNNDDESFVRTRFSLDYRQELTRTSFWGLSGSATIIDVQTGAGTDADRASLGIQYGHRLTPDWNLVARADRSLIYEDGTRTDRTDTFSINLERSFSFRP